MHLWDLCAPSVILSEAGGRLTNVYGRPVDYSRTETANRDGVVAASLAVHDMVINRIASFFQ